MPSYSFNGRSYECPVELSLSVLQGKWKILILWHLSDSTLRYGEIRKALPKITHKMLSQQLKELEADGIVHREVFPVVPPKVEYSLTKLGKTLAPALESLQLWGLGFQQTHHIQINR